MTLTAMWLSRAGRTLNRPISDNANEAKKGISANCPATSLVSGNFFRGVDSSWSIGWGGGADPYALQVVEPDFC